MNKNALFNVCIKILNSVPASVRCPTVGSVYYELLTLHRVINEVVLNFKALIFKHAL